MYLGRWLILFRTRLIKVNKVLYFTAGCYICTMKRIKQSKMILLSSILMVITILLVAGFQFYWLKRAYNSEKENLVKTTDLLFKESIYQLQAKRFKEDTVIFKQAETDDPFLADLVGALKRVKPIPQKRQSFAEIRDGFYLPTADIAIRGSDFFSKDFTDSVLNKIKPENISSVSIIRADSFSRRSMIGSKIIINGKVSTDTPHNLLPLLLNKYAPPSVKIEMKKGSLKNNEPSFSDKQIDSIEKQIRRIKEKTASQSSQIKNFLITSRAVNDTLPVTKIDSAFKDALLKSNIKVNYTILKDTTPKKIDSAFANSASLQTRQVRIGFSRPVAYSAAISEVSPYLLKKISQQILLSALLILLTVLSFFFLYKNLLAQQRLTAMKNEFISNITHELKTPIATVNVAVEAMKNFNVLQSPERTKEYLDISAGELNRLSLLVDKVLRLSMFENKEIELKKEKFSLKQLTEDTVKSMQLQFDKRNAIVELNAPGEDYFVNADKLHISSVLYNLLDNALKYSTDNPEINIAITKNAQELSLTVTDNGMGIPTAYQQKIFDKFFRVPDGDRHNIKGYGLGLSYAAHIIQQHNGSIHVQSEKNKGSSFTIKIPV